MQPINLRVGTASAIGSLPHRQVDAAVAVSLAACPDLPAAPSLPRRDPREGMISQGAVGRAGRRDRRRRLASQIIGGPRSRRPVRHGGCRRHRRARLRGTAGVPRGHTPSHAHPIKLQLTGPVTLGLALVEAGVARRSGLRHRRRGRPAAGRGAARRSDPRRPAGTQGRLRRRTRPRRAVRTPTSRWPPTSPSTSSRARWPPSRTPR